MSIAKCPNLRDYNKIQDFRLPEIIVYGVIMPTRGFIERVILSTEKQRGRYVQQQ